MKGLPDIYWTLGKTALAEQFQYRAAMVIWLIGRVVQPVIYLAVWVVVAQAQGGRIGSFGVGDFAAYYIVIMMVEHFTFTWNMFEMEFRVRTGEFSPLLLQPLHPIHRDIARNISYKFLTTAVMLPTAAMLTLVYEPRLQIVPWSLLAFVGALFLSFLMRFFIEWSLALAAFWTTRVNAFNQMYFLALLFLCGRMAPLELMPPWVQQLAAVLPFRWMVSFPVELFLGRLTPDEALAGFAAQGLWLLLGWGLLGLVWGRGVKRYAAVGS